MGKPLLTPDISKEALSQKIPKSQASAPFPIVGIGASAGGLEAIEQFVAHVPALCGIAFVVVQHLDPTRKALMAELLQRITPMEVVQVTERTRVQPDCVYVIPPNKDMSILHGVLHLFEPTESRSQRLPIDFFFRSLAQDLQHRSIGVILSGMGSDGMLGLRAIKDKMGLVLAQEPLSAKFDSMPRSVIDAGLADIIAPAEDLPAMILDHLEQAVQLRKPQHSDDEKLQGGLEKILILLRTRTNHDFSAYKSNTLYRRIERRMGVHQIERIENYVKFLRENPQEIDLLFKEFLIGVTSFFRDPLAWQILQEETLPSLLAGRSGGTIRAWVAGCSTGEEAYSLAIVFKEALETLKPKENFKLQIFATDLDHDAINKARQGVFSKSLAAAITPVRLQRFFTAEDSCYRIRAEIREMVIFSPHSLIMDPPFTRLDILCCRNLLIYLSSEMQRKLFPLFHYSLTPGGVLLLGNAETIGQFTHLFAVLNAKSRIFRRIESAVRPEAVDFPSLFAPILPAAAGGVNAAAKPKASLLTLAEQWVLQRCAPPTVLVNEQGNILYINGRTGNYLEPAAGKANWNVFAMARDGLRHELIGAFQQAMRQPSPILLNGIKISNNGVTHHVNVSVEKIQENEPLRGLFMIVFTLQAAPLASKEEILPKSQASRGKRVIEMERELQHARAELQGTRDEMQTTHELLKSTNEEMQSTNEEMQSANEELTTSKEEMQSLNEELQTVNAELQCKVDELSRSNNDMKNLLNSTDIATLFLDNNMRVRRFTTQATKIIQLIPGDVGRPITDLASDLLYPELPDDAREVLQKLGFTERAVPLRDGRWYTVRTMPYRTLDDRIDGVVITFWDITVAKTLELKLNDMQLVLEQRLVGQATELDKARVELKVERKRSHEAEEKVINPKNL